MLVDLQGAAYNLYDPEVANLELQSAADKELYFLLGIYWRWLLKISGKTIKVGHFVV